jgi:DNA-binding XRE family transcriptional regulator
MLAALGGANRSILNSAQVDATEMRARGIATLIPAVAAATAGFVTFRFVYHVPAGGAAGAGAMWGLLVLCLDLSLMASGHGRGRLAPRVVILVVRALVSVLAAFTFAGAIVIALFNPDISTQVAADQQHDLAAFKSGTVAPKYAATIASEQSQASHDQGRIGAAEQQVAYWQRQVGMLQTQVTCEAGGVSGVAGCPTGSGTPGRGGVYSVLQIRLQNASHSLVQAQAQAAALSRELGPQIAAAQRDAATLQGQQQAENTAAQNRYAHNDGLIARWRALSELENANTFVKGQVLLWELLIFAIDLTAVISKATSTTPSYDKQVDAERRKVELAADLEVRAAKKASQLRQAALDNQARIHTHQLGTQFKAAQASHRGQLAIKSWRIRRQVRDATSPPPVPAPVPAGALPDQVAAFVRGYRARHGLSQQELAALLGLSVSTVRRLERGNWEPSDDTMRKLADKLGFPTAAGAKTGRPRNLRLVKQPDGTQARRGDATRSG